jgi:hypothetical protein
LTQKFSKPARNALIRELNEKTFLGILEQQLDDPQLTPLNKKRRLLVLVKAWAGSPAEKSRGYPHFEAKLIAEIRSTFAGDALGSDNLIQALQRASHRNGGSVALLAYKLRSTLAQSDRRGSNFNHFYADQIAHYLNGIFLRPSLSAGGYAPLSPAEEREALELYRDFRRRASSRLIYETLREELRNARSRRLTDSALYDVFEKDFNAFGKYPHLDDTFAPHLTLIDCSKLLREDIKN